MLQHSTNVQVQKHIFISKVVIQVNQQVSILQMFCWKRIRDRQQQQVATANKIQMFNIAKNEIVCQFHYKTAKLNEGYQIPQSMILNSGQLPQSMSLLGEQQYHPKTQSCHSCWLNRLVSKHIQSTLTARSYPSNNLGWENNAIITKKLNFLRVQLQHK